MFDWYNMDVNLCKNLLPKILAIAVLVTISDLTDTSSVEIETAHREVNRNITEPGLWKTQTIPAAPATNKSTNSGLCCQGTALYSLLSAVLNGQMGSNARGSATTTGAKNQEKNGKMKTNQGKTGVESSNQETNGAVENNQGNTKGGGSNQKTNGEVKTSQGNTGEVGASNQNTNGKVENNQGNTEGGEVVGGSNNQDPTFPQKCTNYHNLMRAIHAAPDLILDETLNRDAQEWADELARRKTVEHSREAEPNDNTKETDEGENLAEACRFGDEKIENGEKKMTDMWYNEVKKYDWNNPAFSTATGHFTQLVWKNTKMVGFGWSSYSADNGYRCYIAVARYSPEGNVEGQFEENVLKGSYEG